MSEVFETPREQYVAPDNACEACKRRGKDWNGSDPKCAFLTGRFSPDNWSCATAGLIRELQPDLGDAPEDGIFHKRENDQNQMLVHIKDDCVGDGHLPGLALWVSWYKSRGRTDAMWLLNEHDSPVPPTEHDVLAIVIMYRPEI